MSDVKRVTLTTISDVVKKGGGGGGGASIGGPFGALDGVSAMSSAFGGGPAFAGGGGSHSPAGRESSAGSSGAGPEGGKSGSAKKQKTVRLELNLFEPTAESFPEFNFSKLVHEEQKRLKKAQKKHLDDANNGFLSDPELDNDVARMARELERKYGSGTAYAGKEKFARPSKLDYYDRGAGYDEEDSFIDNSEAYDELIPQEIETVGGGFYINSGQLEFKQLSNFERPDDVHRMPKPKKRALSTTSESSDDDEQPANAKKKAEERGQPPVAPAQPAAQTSSEKPTAANPEPPLQQQQPSEGESVNAAGNSGPEVTNSTVDDKPRVNGHVAKKQKLADNGSLGAPKGGAGVEKDKIKSSSATKAAADEGGKEKANGVKTKVSTAITQPTVAGGPTVTLGTPAPVSKKDENENDGGVKPIKTTTVKDMLRAKRDSLRKMEQEKKGRSSGSSRVSSSEAEEDGDGGGDEDDEDEENDEDDDEDDEEDDEDEEMGEGSDKESNESGSEEDIGSESESSHAESTSEKDAAARAKLVTTTNGTGGEGERPVTVVPTEQQQLQKDKEKEKEKERKRKESKLPDELPEPLRKVVETLKELAQTHAIGGKLNYFDSKVAEVLLQVDEGARAAGNSTRNAIFRHLEAQLSISRQSLQLKIKKIRIRKLEGRAKAALDQLEDTICDQMPLLLAKHELDCRKVAEQRAAQAAATAAAPGTNVLPSGGSDPATVNGEKPAGPQTTTTAANTPQIRNPKKRYSWNERTRDLLWELYSIRVETFAFLRPRNETEDDFVAEFLRNKVVPLWPKGWMRYEDLHKELDRRKKALAKSAPAAAVGGPVPKKHPLVVLPPLTSPPSSAIDPSWMTSLGTPTTVMNGAAKATGTPLAGGGGMSGGSPGATAAAPPTSQVPANLSPNGVSNKRGSSDHSISNIMNSPPLPPPPAGEKNRSQPTGRRSFDDDQQLMLSPPNPAGSVVERDGTGAKRGLLVSPPDHRTSLPVSDRPRWNSREDDSDSSIEIIGEYNVIGGSTGAHGVPAGAGVIHSAKSLMQSNPPTPTATTATTTASVLPVLNKEKYKNLIAGKNKGHGSGGGNSPVGSTDTSPTGGVHIGPGKYSKHSPTGAGERMTPQQGTGGGGSLAFTTPCGSTGSTGGGGGIRVSDVTRMKESPSTSSIDLDVHQIMKDLKEYQELQQHHSAGSSRKADATTIPSQQQHDRSQKSKNAPIVVD